ncbi:MAG: PaaI family thioesterase [Acidimicrobiales bacterium]
MSDPAVTANLSAVERLRENLAGVLEPDGDGHRAAAKRVAESLRGAIEKLTATTAPPEVLEAAAATMAEVVALLDGYGSDRHYEGTAEGSGMGLNRAFLDWSPLTGLSNPLAPPIHLSVEGSAVVGRVRFGPAYEGPPGCVHGGFVAAAFDEVLGVTQSLSGQVGMTGTLSVRYRRPTPLFEPLRFEGRLDSVSGRKVLTSAEVTVGGEVTAEATGLFIAVPPETFAALAGNRPG